VQIRAASLSAFRNAEHVKAIGWFVKEYGIAGLDEI